MTGREKLRLAEANYLRELPWLAHLRLRTSKGELGADPAVLPGSGGGLSTVCGPSVGSLGTSVVLRVTGAMVDRAWFNGAVALVLEGFSLRTPSKPMPQHH